MKHSCTLADAECPLKSIGQWCDRGGDVHGLVNWRFPATVEKMVTTLKRAKKWTEKMRQED